MTNRVDPAITFKFWVESKGVIVGAFTKCTGLSTERDTEQYEEGGVNDYVHILPGRIKYSNIILSRGITYANDLWEWYKPANGKLRVANVTIMLWSRQGDVVRRWSIDKAYPVKWSGPDFSTDSNEVAIETLELAHHGIRVI